MGKEIKLLMSDQLQRLGFSQLCACSGFDLAVPLSDALSCKAQNLRYGIFVKYSWAAGFIDVLRSFAIRSSFTALLWTAWPSGNSPRAFLFRRKKVTSGFQTLLIGFHIRQISAAQTRNEADGKLLEPLQSWRNKWQRKRLGVNDQVLALGWTMLHVISVFWVVYVFELASWTRWNDCVKTFGFTASPVKLKPSDLKIYKWVWWFLISLYGGFPLRVLPDVVFAPVAFSLFSKERNRHLDLCNAFLFSLTVCRIQMRRSTYTMGVQLIIQRHDVGGA